MEQPKQPTSAFLDQVQALAKTQAELYGLQATDITARVVANMVSRIILAIILVIIFFFASVGLALWIGTKINPTYMGFFVVAGIWTLAAIGIYALRSRYIHQPVRRTIISAILH